MGMVPDPRLAPWGNYYVILGSAGAALIGLQFVSITLISGLGRRTDARSVSAFGTPTVVYLSSALVISACMCAPWPSLAPVMNVLVVLGVCGLGYLATVLRHASRPTHYTPVLEDWIWYAILPCVTCLQLLVSGTLLRSRPDAALFLIASAALMLLLIGIHNSWDTVTHMVITHSQRNDPGPKPTKDPEP